jgi:hypothetical protein
LHEIDHPTHNGIGLGFAQRGNNGNGKYVCWYVKDKSGYGQSPGSGQAVGFALMQRCPTAWTDYMGVIMGAARLREEIAAVAT